MEKISNLTVSEAGFIINMHNAETCSDEELLKSTLDKTPPRLHSLITNDRLNNKGKAILKKILKLQNHTHGEGVNFTKLLDNKGLGYIYKLMKTCAEKLKERGFHYKEDQVEDMLKLLGK